MKLWIDDTRPAPDGYLWIRSVNVAKAAIIELETQYAKCGIYAHKEMFAEAPLHRANALSLLKNLLKIEVIDIDHDAGTFAVNGGDYIKLLDWLEETGRNYPIRIHSMNPVGAGNMRRIIQRNGWTEVE